MDKKSPGLFVLPVLLFLYTYLAGCGYAGSGEESFVYPAEHQEKRVKIRFLNSWGGLDTKAESLISVFNNFMQNHPDIEIINEAVGGDDFLLKLKTEFASANDPDVFGIWPGSDIQALIHANKVADLTPILENDREWKKSFYDNVWHNVTFNGKIYGLPVEVIFEGLFINTDLFRKYKAPIPANYEQLKEAVVIFNQNGIIPVAFNSKPEGSFLYQNIISMLGKPESIENPFKDGMISDCYVRAMKYVKELYDMEAFPKEAFTLTNDERDALFTNKKAAMIVQGSWFVGNFDKNSQVDFVPFPWIQEEDTVYPTMVYGLGGGVFYMSENASLEELKKGACIRLLKHLTHKDTALYFAKSTGMISNVKINGDILKYDYLVQKGIDYVDISPKLVAPPDHFVNRSTWEDVIVELFPYYLEGKYSAYDVWKDAYSKRNR